MRKIRIKDFCFCSSESEEDSDDSDGGKKKKKKKKKRRRIKGGDDSRSGHQLNSILLTFQNQESMYKSAFSTNAQSRFASVVVDGMSWDLRA